MNVAHPAIESGPKSEQTRIGFCVHPELSWLVAPVGVIAQLAFAPVLAPVPNVSPWLRGVLNLRGILVPVFDLAQWFGFAPQPLNATVLVLAPGPEAMGLMCCSEPRLISVDANDASTVDGTMASIAISRLASAEGWVYEFEHRSWLRRVGREVPKRSAAA